MSISSYSGSCRVRFAFSRDQLLVGKRRLRIFVEEFQIGARRRRIEIVVIFLYVFAVIPFADS